MKHLTDLQSTFKFLKEIQVKVDKKEFEFQLLSHPDYSSLLSFSDTLKFFGVDNNVVKTDVNVEDLPKIFLAIINLEDKVQKLCCVKVKKKGFDVDGFFLNDNEFKEKWSGILLHSTIETINLTERKKGEFKNTFKFLLTILFCSFLFYLLFSISSPLFDMYLITSSIGLFISIETLRQEFGVSSSIIGEFCGVTPNSDCEGVINSNDWGVFKKIKLNEIAFVFFLTQLVALTVMVFSNQTSTFFFLHSIGLWLSIPIGFASIYYQMKIVKVWCPLCLILTIILLTQLVFQFYFLPNPSYTLNGIFTYILVFIPMLLIWLNLKPILVDYADSKNSLIENIRFKRNYQLFKLALYNSDSMSLISTEGALILGNKKAPLKIDLFTSPFCGFCKNAHEEIRAILDQHKNELAIHLRFSFTPDRFIDKERTFIVKGLIQSYLQEDQETFLDKLHYWYQNRDLENWKSYYNPGPQDEEINQIIFQQTDWKRINKLSLTPSIIINNHPFPSTHNRSDLRHYLNDLIEDNKLKSFM